MNEKRQQYRKKPSSFITAVQLDLTTSGFTYEKWGATQTFKPGDWLVNNNGDTYSVDRQVFARTYSQVSPGVYFKSTPVWAFPADKAGSVKTREGETNYKADQEGLIKFRYSIRPHTGVYDQTAASRFGVERSQPLIAIPAGEGGLPAVDSILTVDSRGVMVTSIKPAREGEAWMIRLYAASGKPERVNISWGGLKPSTVYVSNPDQRRGRPVAGPIDLPAYGIVTLRAETK